MDARNISEPQASSGISRFLKSFAPVKRSEVLTVLLLSINVFVLLTCYYVLKVAREPLILLGGGAELKAYASAGQTILLLGVVPAFGWLSSRVSRLRLMTTMQIIFMGCLVGFYVLAKAQAPIGLAFYLWVGIFNVLVVSNFWSFANDLYTEEEGKRLFAVIGVGASLGAIVGAFVPHALNKLMGLEGLLLVAFGCLCVSIVLYRVVDIRERAKQERVKSERAAKKADEPKFSKKGGFSLVIKDRYLRLLAGMLLIATIINTTGEYVIGKMATERSKTYAAEKVAKQAPAAQPAAPMPQPDSTQDKAKAEGGQKGLKANDTPSKGEHADKDAMKAAQDEYLNNFYSSYYTLVNLISALLQALIVARLLTKLGLRKALFIMPMIVLGGWFALIMFVNITTVRIEKTAENSLDYSLHNTIRQALFLPTSREAKFKAKAAIDTFVFRMGDVIAGLGIVALFVEVLGLGVRAFAMLNVCLAAVWLLLAYRAGKVHDELIAERPAEDPADRSAPAA